MVSSSSSSSAAAVFSSRCFTLDVPGIGSITGERCSSQASATCEGVAPSRSAARASGPPAAARSPVASGNHGMNPIALGLAVVQHVLALAVGQVVEF